MPNLREARRSSWRTRSLAARRPTRLLDPAAGSWLVPAVRPNNPRSWLWLVIAVAAVASAGAALAEGRSKDRAATESKLRSISAAARHRRVTAEPVARARRALRRAEDVRAAGDQHHGLMLEALALEWAEAAEALTRAAEIERQAVLMERKLSRAETKAIRAKALVEETLARRGRAQKKLEQLERGSTPGKKAGAGGGER